MTDFFVYSRTTALPLLVDCKVIKLGDLVQGIFTKAFGPSSESDCQKWASDNCTQKGLIDGEGNSSKPGVSYSDDELYVTITEGASAVSFFPIYEGSVLPRFSSANFELSIPAGPVATANFSSQEGARVTQRLVFVGGGGHSHGQNTMDPRAVGSVSPRSFTLIGQYPQNMEVTYSCGDAAGTVYWEVTFDLPDGRVDVLYININGSVSGLQPLASSQSIVLVGPTPSHPSNHFGTPTLCTGIASLAAAFYGKFNKPIYVNDMSLVGGGIFDINANFAPDHITHRQGRNVDINHSSMTEDQREFFRSTAEALGFSVSAHGTPVHWHLTM